MKVGKVKAFFGGVNLVVSLREMSVESARYKLLFADDRDDKVIKRC